MRRRHRHRRPIRCASCGLRPNSALRVERFRTAPTAGRTVFFCTDAGVRCFLVWVRRSLREVDREETTTRSGTMLDLREPSMEVESWVDPPCEW